MEQLQNFQGIEGKVTSICKNISRVFGATCASREEFEKLRHELSQFHAEGSYDQILYTTSRCGASESSSEIQQLRQERDHLNDHCRNLETRNASMSKRGSFSGSASCANSSFEKGIIEVEGQKSSTLQAVGLRLLSRECTDL